MGAGNVLESLLEAGRSLQTGFESARKNAGSGLDWGQFLQSDEFKQCQNAVTGALARLKADQIQAAIKAVVKAQEKLLKGRQVDELPFEELTKYSALGDARSLLVSKQLEAIGLTVPFVSWLVDEALPVLLKVARVVMPVLLAA